MGIEQYDKERDERERAEYERRRREEPLLIMSALIASGMSGNADMTPAQIEDRALKIAQGLYGKVRALP